MPPEALTARELTRRLVSASARGDESDSAALAAEAACERTYRDLIRRVGPTGAHALLARALAQAKADHSLLSEIRLGKELNIARPGEPGLNGVAEIVQTHGAPAVASALEALLEKLIGLLGRLIGDDMVARLLEPDPPIRMKDSEGLK